MTDRLHNLERERERLETALADDANWRAFRDAQQRRANGLPGGAVPKEIAIALSENELVAAYLRLVSDIAAELKARPEASADESAAADVPAPEARKVASSEAIEEAAAFRTRVHVKAPVSGEALPEADDVRTTADVPGVAEVSILPATTRIDETDRHADHGEYHDHKDDLTQIRRIDRRLAAALRGLGVRNFRQIALWTASDVHHVREALDLGPRISRENWIEQAALLVMRNSGRALEPATVRPTAPPVAHLEGRQADAPALTGVRARQPASASAPLTVPLGRHLQDERPIAAATVPAVAMAGQAPLLDPADAIRVGRRAKRLPAPAARRFVYIRGVSERLAEAMRAAGVQSLADIAGWSRADVRWFRAVLGGDARISEDSWIEQAHLLASGVWTRYALRVVSGEMRTVVDRPPPLSVQPASAEEEPEFGGPLAPAADVDAARLDAARLAASGVAVDVPDRARTAIVAVEAAAMSQPRPINGPTSASPAAGTAPDPARSGVRSSLLVGNLRRPPPDLGVRWMQPVGDSQVQRGRLTDMPAFMRRAFPNEKPTVTASQADDALADGQVRRPGLRESLERAVRSTPTLGAPAVPPPAVLMPAVPAKPGVSAVELPVAHVADPSHPFVDPPIIDVVDDWDDAEALVVVRTKPRLAAAAVDNEIAGSRVEAPSPGYRPRSSQPPETGVDDAVGFAFASGDEAEVVIIAKPHAEIAAPQALHTASEPPSRVEPQQSSVKPLSSADRIARRMHDTRLRDDAADDERASYRDFAEEATVTIIRAEASERSAASIVPTEIANDAEATDDAPLQPVARKIGARFLKALTGD